MPENHKSFEILASRHFTTWLNDQNISLAFSSYQSGKLFLLGRRPDGNLSVFERSFNRSMGLWSDSQTIWLATAFQIWRFENVIAANELDNGYDRLYIPRTGYTTGDVDIHDLAVTKTNRVVFITTLFNSLATISKQYSFHPLWRPPFISQLIAEDRCHLNGLCMVAGQPRYATACAATDVIDGWRDCRQTGGCVLDMNNQTILATGLSMPHSPRWYQGKLYLLESGTGFFGYLNIDNGQFERITFCPGYARGLAFVGDYAVVGLSNTRGDKSFAGLELDANLGTSTARCGLLVIDLRSGEICHWLRVEGSIEELYDVTILPGVVRPKALGFKSDEIRYNVWLAQDGQPRHWSGHQKINCFQIP